VNRTARVERVTRETQILVELDRDEIEAQVVFALVATKKSDPQSNRALWMGGRQLLGINRIECTQQV